MPEFDTDVVVVGLGAWGSSALWRLAARGVDVVGIERFGAGHGQGSSHGETRLFRVACQEHPDLVPLARRAGELWRELEEASGEELLRITGGITIGPPDEETMTRTLAAARAHELPIEQLTASQVRARFPQHTNVPDDFVGVLDPLAGVVKAEASVRAAHAAARSAGATIYCDTRVTSIHLVDGGVVVTTPLREFTARQAVVTAGAWLSKLVTMIPLETLRIPMNWYRAHDDATRNQFDVDDFPVFIRYVDQHRSLWGHGAVFGHDVKVGLTERCSTPAVARTDPDQCDRGVSPQDWFRASSSLAIAVANLDPLPVRTVPCLITNSPDSQFLIGRPGSDPRLVIGGGCSGHGFKHATGIGEALAQITVGEQTFCDLRFTDPNRFSCRRTAGTDSRR
jgi:sarcosine oxidase